MHLPLISIIIPVYNTEKYLRKCLNSIISQTYQNWEAIVVNDGSTDNCRSICDEYSIKDRRFKIIHKKNQGVSVARQTGLDNCTGNYVIHCDPDDWIEPTMIEELVKIVNRDKSDMVICDYYEEKRSGSSYIQQDITSPISSKQILTKIITHKLHGNCWNKLIKREHCSEISFTPTNLYCYEDELFIIRLLLKELKISYYSKALYHYKTDNNTSLTHNADKRIESKIKEIAELEKIIDIKEFDNLFLTKEKLLRDLFLNKRLDLITNIYKDTHIRIINAHTQYKFFTPLGFFFTLAIKGMPYFAYYAYTINIKAINLVQKIRHIFITR